MNASVRTTHSTSLLLKISKIVAVLLLIFFPVIALANPIYQSSSSRYSNPSAVGAQSMQYQPASYQMTNTSAYQMGTTLSPAQTLYTPFSNETPSQGSNGSSRISGRKNNVSTGGFGNEPDPEVSDKSPIGDAWSLLIFAAAAAGVIFLKQRKRLDVKD